MKTFRNKMAGFTLVEIMIVVLIIGILLAIAIPNFVQAREAGRAKACIGNLKQIDSAKQQCAMDNKLQGTDVATTFYTDGTTAPSAGKYQLVNSASGSSYIRTVPSCPSGGTYNPGTVASGITGAIPSYCSTSGYIGAPASGAGTDYLPPATRGAAAGRYYHGIDL